MAKTEGTSEETSGLVPQPHGGALKPGGDGKSGGRPPDEFKREMARMASSDEALAYLEECLRGDHGGKVAMAAHKYVADRGYGKVTQPISGPNGEAAFKIYAGFDPEQV